MRAKGREQMHKLQNPQSKHEMQTDLRKMQAKSYAEAATNNKFTTHREWDVEAAATTSTSQTTEG